MNSDFEIIIPTFVSPLLFWVVEKGTFTKNNKICMIEKSMNEYFATHRTKYAESFKVGQVVALKHNKKYCRAIIENVSIDRLERTSVTRYICWLIDHGIMVDTHVVFILPDNIQQVPPIAKQACLNNVIFLEKHLSYENFKGLVSNEPTLIPHQGARQISLNCLSKASKLKFHTDKIINGVLFGDIIYHDSGESKMLIQELVKQEVVAIDQGLFLEIANQVGNFRHSEIEYILEICKNKHEVSEAEKIVQKYLDEFGGRENSEETPHRISQIRKKRQSSNTSHTSENGTTTDNSESEPTSGLNSPIDSNKNEKKLLLTEGIKLKRSDILKMRLKHKSAKHVDDSLFSHDKPCPSDEFVMDIKNSSINTKPKVCEISPSDSKRKLQEYLRKKKALAVISPQNTATNSSVPTNSVKNESSFGDASSENSENINPQVIWPQKSERKSLPKNVVFCAGGASFTLQPRRKCIQNNDLSEATSSKSVTRLNKGGMESSTNESVDDSTSSKIEESEELQEQESVENFEPTRIKAKPACACKNCDLWTHHEGWDTKLPEFEQQAKKKTFLVAKPPPLLKDEALLVEEVNIVTVEHNLMSKLQKQASSKVLVHGESIPNAVKLISELNFHQDIHRTLKKLGYEDSKRIQSYAWPALMRLQNVCLVGNPCSGKTMAYLPVVCSFVMEKFDRYEPLMKYGGPIVIILCTNSKNCEDIYDLIKILMGRSKSRIVLGTYPLGHMNMSNIDILVTLPSVLVDLLRSNAINLKRLCHLVLEDVDAMLKKDSQTIDKLLKVTEEMLSHRVCMKPVQMICISNHWNLKVEQLLKRLNKTPLVCISNYLEAALYGRVGFTMKLLNSACKEMDLKTLLKERFHICKTIIFCDKDEIEYVSDMLMIKGIEHIVTAENYKKEDIILHEDMWSKAKPGQYKALLCTDFIFTSMLTVTDAMLLVHYSLPQTWTVFVKRFSCLLDSIESPMSSSKKKQKCQSYVLTDENCIKQIPKFISYLNGLDIKLPDNLEHFSKDYQISQENDKITRQISLCEELKLFGKCPHPRCSARHILDSKLDLLDCMPKCGKVRFQICEIVDVTHFTARLIEAFDEKNTKTTFEQHDISEDLKNSLNDNKVRVKRPVVGHFYAFYDMDDTDCFYRCELVEVENQDFVKIKLIDVGTMKNTLVSRLYKLPDEIHARPRQVIDIYLANHIPPYGDENFSAKSFFKVQHMLQIADYKNITLTADIHLQLGYSLWVKNVIEEVLVSGVTVCKFRMSKSIQDLKLVEVNSMQLVNLYKLCMKANIELPSYEVTKVPLVNKEKHQVAPQWAFLDHENPNEVTLSAAISPDEIYFRLNKYSHELYNLQRELQIASSKPNSSTNLTVSVGKCYLVKDPLGTDYSRAIVIKMEDNKALCFFVDYGDETVVDISEMKFLSNYLISKFPFQSIQCLLHGIKPVLNEWQENVTDILYQYSTEPDTDIFRCLFIKTAEPRTTSSIGQNHYSVILKDSFSEKQTLINELFVDCGFAEYINGPVEDFPIPERIEIQPSGSDDEVEEIIDICKKTEQLGHGFDETNEFINEEGEEIVEIDGMELCIFDPIKFFNLLVDSRPEAPTEYKRELPAIQAAGPSVDYSTPEVYWSQTENNIKIKIMLSNVTDYTLHVLKGRMFNFRTVVNEKTYLLKLILYEKVTTHSHTVVGPEIRVTLEKAKVVEWPRLILSETRARNIHYDVSAIVIEEEKKRGLLEFPELQDDESDNDEDENEGFMYHNVSDMDSDLEQDLVLSD